MGVLFRQRHDLHVHWVGGVGQTSALLLSKDAKVRYTRTVAITVKRPPSLTVPGTRPAALKAGRSICRASRRGRRQHGLQHRHRHRLAHREQRAGPDPGRPLMGTTDEDTAKTIGLSGTFINNGTGTTTITDVDPNAVVGGIALVAITGNGTWAYSTDGTTFNAVGTVAEPRQCSWPRRHAALHARTARTARRPPLRTERGTQPAAQAAGGPIYRNRPTADATAFSTATDTASLSVTDVNDAPVLTAVSPLAGRPLRQARRKTSACLRRSSTTAPGRRPSPTTIRSRGGRNRPGRRHRQRDLGVFDRWHDVRPRGHGLRTDSALLLPDGYAPLHADGTSSERATITYRGWDTTSGTAGGTGRHDHKRRHHGLQHRHRHRHTYRQHRAGLHPRQSFAGKHR